MHAVDRWVLLLFSLKQNSVGEPRAWAQNYAKHKITLVEESQNTSRWSLFTERRYGCSEVSESLQRGPCPYIPPSKFMTPYTNDFFQRIPTGSRLRRLLYAQITMLSPNRSQSSFSYSYLTSRPTCDNLLHLKLVA